MADGDRDPKFKMWWTPHFKWDTSYTGELSRKPLLMREMQQYVLTPDDECLRWDVAYMHFDGSPRQVSLAMESDWRTWVGRLPELREKARARFDEAIPAGVKMLRLNVPRTALEVAYV